MTSEPDCNSHTSMHFPQIGTWYSKRDVQAGEQTYSKGRLCSAVAAFTSYSIRAVFHIQYMRVVRIPRRDISGYSGIYRAILKFVRAVHGEREREREIIARVFCCNPLWCLIGSRCATCEFSIGITHKCAPIAESRRCAHIRLIHTCL